MSRPAAPCPLGSSQQAARCSFQADSAHHWVPLLDSADCRFRGCIRLLMMASPIRSGSPISSFNDPLCAKNASCPVPYWTNCAARRSTSAAVWSKPLRARQAGFPKQPSFLSLFPLGSMSSFGPFELLGHPAGSDSWSARECSTHPGRVLPSAPKRASTIRPLRPVLRATPVAPPYRWPCNVPSKRVLL